MSTNNGGHVVGNPKKPGKPAAGKAGKGNELGNGRTVAAKKAKKKKR